MLLRGLCVVDDIAFFGICPQVRGFGWCLPCGHLFQSQSDYLHGWLLWTAMASMRFPAAVLERV